MKIETNRIVATSTAAYTTFTLGNTGLKAHCLYAQCALWTPVEKGN